MLRVLVTMAFAAAASGTACGGEESVTPTPTTSAGATGGGGSGVGGAGVGGTGGVHGMAGTDKCPGQAVSVGSTSVTLRGTTVGATDDYSAYCANGKASGKDVVFAVTPTETGTMTLTLENSNGLNGVLYARAVCEDNGDANQLGCADSGTATKTIQLPVERSKTFFVIVDGRDGTAGDFKLGLKLAPPICGDGVINPDTETCDDGNTSAGDGCDPSCQFEKPTDMSDKCPGQPEQVELNKPLVIKGFTTGYTDDYQTCGSPAAPGKGGPDRVFQIVPKQSGKLTLTLPNLGAAGGGFDGMLSAWAGPTCDPTNRTMPPYLGCSDGADASATESLTFPVTAGTPYFVVVDGYASYSYGNFELTASLSP